MYQELFKELGFTDAEAAVYLTLLSLGPTTSGPVVQKTKLQNAVVHRNLHRLIENGLVSFVMQGRRRTYTAIDPAQLVRMLDERRRRLMDALPSLLLLQKPYEKQESKVFKGIKGFKAALAEFIEGAQAGDEYLIFSLGVEDLNKFENIIAYYREFERERKAKGIVSKAIAPHAHRRQLQESAKSINIRYVKFPTPLDVSIFRDRILLSSWSDEPAFFIITSAPLSESFRKYFASVWDAIAR